MHRLLHRVAIVAVVGGGACALALIACRDDTGAGAPLCRGSIEAASPAVDAGARVVLSVHVANLDDDVATTVTATWSLSGGGTLDHPVSHVVLTPQNDPYGNPAGISGSAGNTFFTQGPTGSYTVRATVDAFGRCDSAKYEVTVQVNGSAPDGGASGDASDAAVNDAADDATDAPTDAVEERIDP